MNRTILFTANTAWNLYNFRLPVMKAFHEAGWEVVGVAPEDVYAGQLTKTGIRFTPVRITRSGTNPLKDLFTYMQLRRIYRRVRPAVVCHYTIKPNIYGAMAAASLGIPAVNNISGLGTVFISRSPLTAFVRLLYKVSQRRAARVFFQNDDDRQEFIRHGLVDEKQTGLLPGSGVELERFQKEPLPARSKDTDHPFTFLMISRLLEDKGAREFIEAAGRLKVVFGPRIRFTVAGSTDTDNRTTLTNDEVEAARAAGTVEFIGKLEDIRDAIRDAHCVVLPSYREGTPRSLLEAAAMGRPLVATDVPGCREVVEDGVNGYLCVSRDAGSLAEAMERLYRLDGAELRRFGDASRRMAEEKFSIQRVIEQYQTSIEDILKGHG